MQTRLGVFCDRIMEAGWLMAAILAPLYFNVYSNRVFEPDKLALVRSIAVLMSLAWLIKMIEQALAGGRGKDVPGEQPAASLLQRINRRNILALPTLALVAAYIISSLGSVAPMITLWGSYQRLQGTYSTFSYIVIFFLAASVIHRREQIDRLVTVIILTSLPIAIYGVIEHLKLEFLPWGGDVTLRVTSTMGNPIFIAAYLIMTVPLAMSRFLERLSAFREANSGGEPSLSPAAAGVLAGGQVVAWFLLIYAGLKVYGNMIQSKGSSALDLVLLFVALILTIGLPFTVRKGLPHFISAGLYGTAALVGLATILFSQSRGPQLGLAAGLSVFVFLYAMKRNSRLIWYGGLAAAITALALLVVMNIPNSPLSFMRDAPYIGRLAMLIEEGGSTSVRSLIWQGARELIGTHEPIGVPGGYTDNLNAIRPLIGYGPDAMYVAYNRYYPADLAHYEARNASPDRSHNETFDALVMTGILGYLAYWVVFYTVIYIALIYLKVIDERHGRPLYIALLLTGVAALLILYSNILPIKFAPGPALLGVVVLAGYLVVAGFAGYDWKAKMHALDPTLIALVSAVVAHFVEIQFGIAIASTRTHFWLFAALIVVIGRMLSAPEAAQDRETVAAPAAERPLAAAAPAQRPATTAASFSKKKKTVAAGRPRQDMRQSGRQAPPRSADAGLWGYIVRAVPTALPLAVVGGVILSTLAYNFMLPPNTATAPAATTPVQFWLYFLTWIACGLIVALDSRPDAKRDEMSERIASLIVYTTVSLAMWVGYVGLRGLVLRANGTQIDSISLVTVYYVAVLLYGLLLAVVLYRQRRSEAVRAWSGPTGGIIYAIAGVLAFVFIVFTNVNIVLADVHYKTGLAYDNAARYDGSVLAYQSAIQMTPSQDFYYLFLGRSLMELARQSEERTVSPAYDPARENPVDMARDRLAALGRTDLIRASLVVLERARALNPLNTDHYANLGRLHRFWGEASGDAGKYDLADGFFKQATILSPNNAQLWNEWAIVSILRGQADDAESKLQHSLSLDERYDLTYYYQGNLYMSLGENSQDNDQRLNYLTRAADAYSGCLKVSPTYWECAKARGYIYGKYLGRSAEAVTDFLLVVRSLPSVQDVSRIANTSDRQRYTQELINVHQNLAITYAQMGNIDQALVHAQTAAGLAPSDQSLKNLVEQLKTQQKK